MPSGRHSLIARLGTPWQKGRHAFVQDPPVNDPGADVTAFVDEIYYKGMLDVLPERVIRFRLPDLTILYCNAAWAAGHGMSPDEVIGSTMDEMLSLAGRADLELQLVRLGPDNPVVTDDTARPAPNAPGQWVEWVDQYLPSAAGAEVLAVGRDVTGRHIAELFLADSEARFRDLADKSADVVWRFFTDPYPHFDYISPSIESILGYPATIFIDDFNRLLEILDHDGRALIRRALEGEPMPLRYDLRYRCTDGSIAIFETQTTDIPGGMQGVSRDVTELRRLQTSLAALALRDPLTGLANRHLLNELLDAALVRSERNGLPLAVAFLDLDGLKFVNDSFGHDAGDTVLRETARRLQSLARKADVVARLGGDEFVIVYEPNDSSADTLISRISETLSAPISISETLTVCCTASIGHADTRTVGRDPATLLATADRAMYEAKREHNRDLVT
jgi:diguanylate cyclase (GGDEF)-like protein/PAS domain S-box-containing protein